MFQPPNNSTEPLQSISSASPELLQSLSRASSVCVGARMRVCACACVCVCVSARARLRVSACVPGFVGINVFII